MKLDVASFDLDGTLIHPAIFNAVADRLGFGEPLRESYQAYLDGRLSLEDAFHHDYAHFVGRRVADLEEALRHNRGWTRGIPEAVHMLRDAGWRVVVTTDQPLFLAGFTSRFGVDDVVASEADVEDGVVTDRCRPAFDKWANLAAFLDREGIDPARVAHVGNGRNDVPVFERVGFAVAVNAEHPGVEAAADVTIPVLRDLRDVAAVLLDATRDAKRNA